MRKSSLTILGLCFSVPLAALAVQKFDLRDALFAFAEPPSLMEGCTDVPEAVALAGELSTRALRIERYMEAMEVRKTEIADAEASLRKRLGELRSLKNGMQSIRTTKSTAVQSDIDRLVAVYDQMKPTEAAAVLSNLPPSFAAEILMRVQPETGARIIAAVDPAQAAMLTTHMGARNARNN